MENGNGNGFSSAFTRLGLSAFDSAFDKHFRIHSAFIDDALQRGTTSVNSQQEECRLMPGLKNRPEAWGMPVDTVYRFWEYIADDLKGYALAHHLMEEDSRHVCLAAFQSHGPCCWQHAGSLPMTHGLTNTRVPLRPNMHLVVERYVKPWTEGKRAGLSLVLNAGKISRIQGCTVKSICIAQVYVSHSWKEDFSAFAATLYKTLDPRIVVWISALGMYQNVDTFVTGKFETLPFTLALSLCDRVLLVADREAAVLQRSWVVLEAEFASKFEKPYDITFPDDGDMELRQKLAKHLCEMDVGACTASRQGDQAAICNHARSGPGGLDKLNEVVRDLLRAAMKHSELMSIATAGDVERLKHVEDNRLNSWVNIQGRCAAHIAAEHSQVAMLLEILQRSKHALNAVDEDGRTPVSIAAEKGQLAAMGALISLHADVEHRSKDGRTALHYAAFHGQTTAAELLISGNAQVEAECIFGGVDRVRAIRIASQAGHANTIRTLVKARADAQAVAADGCTALHVAASKGFTDAVAALLVAGADVDMPTADSFGLTPLILAAEKGHYDVVCMLLGRKANIDAKDKRGLTCFGSSVRCRDEAAREQVRRVLQCSQPVPATGGAAEKLKQQRKPLEFIGGRDIAGRPAAPCEACGGIGRGYHGVQLCKLCNGTGQSCTQLVLKEKARLGVFGLVSGVAAGAFCGAAHPIPGALAGLGGCLGGIWRLLKR